MKFISGNLLFFNSIVGLMAFTFFGGRNGTRHATFERFDNMCAGKKTPLIFNYSGLRNDGNKVWMNCTITVKEDVLIHPKMVMVLDRCKSKENLDSCEQFYENTETKYCEALQKHQPLWEPFYSAFQPKWQCPIKKGIYTATDALLDASAFLLFPMDSWVWKLKVEMRHPDTDRVLMCLLIQAHVILEKN